MDPSYDGGGSGSGGGGDSDSDSDGDGDGGGDDEQEEDEEGRLYTITLITMFVPTCTLLVGDPLSGNGCGLPNHI